MNAKNIDDKGNLLMGALITVPACQSGEGDTDWFPAVDVTKTRQEYVVQVDLPGLKPEEVQLRVDSDVLSISGQRATRPPGGKRVRIERPSGAFVRQLPLPQDAHGEILANFCDGVLELRVPRACPDSEPGQAHAVGRKPEEVVP